MTSAPRVLVLGVGNPLMGDEGFGPRVVEALRSQFSFPANANVIDAGTMGFTILNLFADVERVIVVDAIDKTAHPAGTLLRLTPEDMSPNQVRHSLHDTRLTDVLDAARLIGLNPEVACIGVQVDRVVHWKLDLSPPVEAAVPLAVDAVLSVLESWGVRPSATGGSGEDVDARMLESLRTRQPIREPTSKPVPEPSPDETPD